MSIKFTILGEAASKANSRKMAMVGPADNRRMLFIKSKKALGYEADAPRQIPPTARVQMQGPVKITLRIFYATERPDLDESLILDILQDRYAKNKRTKERELVQRGVYLNDRQVREKHVYHAIDRNNPRTEVEVEPMEKQLFDDAPLIAHAPRKAIFAEGPPF